MKEELKKYLHHLPTCNIKQDWSEAEQAMADTPQRFRDESWDKAYYEMRMKMMTCTCGLDTILLSIEQDLDLNLTINKNNLQPIKTAVEQEQPKDTNVLNPDFNREQQSLPEDEIKKGIPFKCPNCGEEIQYGFSEDGMRKIMTSKLFKSHAPQSYQVPSDEKKPTHARDNIDFLAILTKWCEYYDTSFCGKDTAVIESALDEYLKSLPPQSYQVLSDEEIEKWISSEMPINVDDINDEKINKWCRKAVRLFAIYFKSQIKAVDIKEVILDAYQRGYEDRDFDIGYHSNLSYLFERYLAQRDKTE